MKNDKFFCRRQLRRDSTQTEHNLNRPEEKLRDGVSDGTRTHDDWNHNPGLYQLSYTHHNNVCILCASDNHSQVWRARQDSNLQPPA